MFGAVAGGALQLLKSSGTYNMSFSTAGTMNSPILVGEIDIIKKKKSSSKYIRNCNQTTYLPIGEEEKKYFGRNKRQKAWMVGEKFGLNNKVKEVSFKILHKIYPTQKTVNI